LAVEPVSSYGMQFGDVQDDLGRDVRLLRTLDGEEQRQTRRNRELAAEAGHRMNWNRVSQEQMYAASAESHNQGNNVGLAALIRAPIEPPKVFCAPTEPGHGTARDRKELADEAHLLLRSTRGNIRRHGAAWTAPLPGFVTIPHSRGHVEKVHADDGGRMTAKPLSTLFLVSQRPRRASFRGQCPDSRRSNRNLKIALYPAR
jgi:hypothetical protein